MFSSISEINLWKPFCRKEDEIGVDNIRDVDIPSHLGEKFIEDDKNFIEDK